MPPQPRLGFGFFSSSHPDPAASQSYLPLVARRKNRIIKVTLHFGAGSLCWMLYRESLCASLKKKKKSFVAARLNWSEKILYLTDRSTGKTRGCEDAGRREGGKKTCCWEVDIANFLKIQLLYPASAVPARLRSWAPMFFFHATQHDSSAAWAAAVPGLTHAFNEKPA